MSRPFIQLAVTIGAENHAELSRKFPVMGIQQSLLDFATSSGIGKIVSHDTGVKSWAIPGEAAEVLAGILGCEPDGRTIYKTVIERFYDAAAHAVRAEQVRLINEMLSHRA